MKNVYRKNVKEFNEGELPIQIAEGLLRGKKVYIDSASNLENLVIADAIVKANKILEPDYLVSTSISRMKNAEIIDGEMVIHEVTRWILKRRDCKM